MIPEIQIKKLLDFFIDRVDENYLYYIFGDYNVGSYCFSENAKSIFLKNSQSDRQIETHVFFNHERPNLPTVHINMPSESMTGEGIDWEPSEKYISCEEKVVRVGQRAYGAKFNIIFTSSNTFEVLIMYTVIKSLIQGNIALLEQNGLRNPRLSGSDIIFNEGFMPQSIYSRALMIDCVYTFEGISLQSKFEPKSVIFNGEMEL